MVILLEVVLWELSYYEFYVVLIGLIHEGVHMYSLNQSYIK